MMNPRNCFDICKKLVFHIYVYDDINYRENVAYKMHLECLKKYSYIFDKACFNISVDNVEKKDLISKIKHDLIDCNFKNIEIIVTKNNYFCETNTFKFFILDNLKNENDLIFFGHTKGIINVLDGINYVDNILHWVYSMYFFNLEEIYVNEMLLSLVKSAGGYQKTFYGGIRGYLPEINASFYPGTFYWFNPMKLYEDDKQGRVLIPKIYNRNFCEELPIIYKNEHDIYHGLASYHNKGVYEYLYNDNNWDDISYDLTDGENNRYKEIYNEIINEIKHE